ncbi:2-oxo acid dehydrogenase subunit E2 [Neobacillus sp. 179-C4.2 HS]|uniref:2-oxo acid dehydrogenase subunit E2 n=1 Tax=Neobacillus driksii TaxID=3035913 RepID=A0ABV4YV26_9BACI|nr:2-oxo acid dehydrogenase subunit E2 [Neobacillus sp. 179.-C4.2 HS]MDP5192863.1 2-oxo acid dehydrogenase subunit E2 [Neobacillus sp. 179.-C4.2 HS]
MNHTKDQFGREIKEIIPVKGSRKIIGRRMKESLERSPQGTAMVKADMTGLIRYRAMLKERGETISFVDLFVKVAGLALDENPMLNASLQENEIIVYQSIHIGIAVFIEGNLYVPVIQDVQDKNILEISSEVKGIIMKLKEKRFKDVLMNGSTFTVNNMGMLEIDGFTPFINPPEAAILGIGKTRKEVVVDESGDTIVIKPMTTLSLTNDHAVVDGVPVAKFLESFKRIMNKPEDFLG